MATRQPEYIQTSGTNQNPMNRFFYNTGSFWLTGFCFGGAYGFLEGWREAVSPNMRIRFNSVMNGISRRGASWGNSLGAVAFLHTSLVYVADELKIDYYLPSEFTKPAFAGFFTGAIYKSTRGVRAATLAACIGSVSSMAYWNGGRWIMYQLSGGKRKY